MGQRYRRSRHTLLLMTERKDGTVKRRTINSAVVEVAAAVLFILAVVIICKIIYDEITLKNARKEIVDQIITINNLTD